MWATSCTRLPGPVEFGIGVDYIPGPTVLWNARRGSKGAGTEEQPQVLPCEPQFPWLTREVGRIPG